MCKSKGRCCTATTTVTGVYPVVPVSRNRCLAVRWLAPLTELSRRHPIRWLLCHPGIPRKYAGDSTAVSVLDVGTDALRYRTDLDAFGGNSGSGVFTNGNSQNVRQLRHHFRVISQLYTTV